MAWLRTVKLEPREWTYDDLLGVLGCEESLARARRELGYEAPFTAKQVYELIERAYSNYGAWLLRKQNKT